MIEVSSFNYFTLSAIIILSVGLLLLLQFLIKYFFNWLQLRKISLRIMLSKIIEILFSILILFLFNLLSPELFSFTRIKTGLIFLGIGLIIALPVAYLSYSAIKTGEFGEKYGQILAKTPSDKFLTFITLLILVGPAEDLFFIGFVQNILIDRLGWISVLVYILLFTGYHYINVLSGIEAKQEFMMMLPVRLIIATVLSLSFLLTKTIVYTLLIHNLFDTLNYLALLSARKIPEQ